MKALTLIFVCLSLISLSACETLRHHDIGPTMRDVNWAFWKTKNEPPVHVATQQDRGVALTPTVPGFNNLHIPGTASVEVMGVPGMPLPTASAPTPPPTSILPFQTQGIVTNDSSVTIFPLEGGGGFVPSTPIGQNMNTSPNNYNNQYVQPMVPYHGNVGAQIFFNHGSSRLGSVDKQRLDNVSQQAEYSPMGYVTVNGHASRPTAVGTGSVTADIINLKQSVDRAFAVSRDLLLNGVPARRIKTVGWGSAQSVGMNKQDQRVDVVIGDQ